MTEIGENKKFNKKHRIIQANKFEPNQGPEIKKGRIIHNQNHN